MPTANAKESPSNLANNLKTILRLKNLSVDAFAERVGIPAAEIKKIRDGMVVDTRDPIIEKIAAALFLTPDFLCAWLSESEIKLALVCGALSLALPRTDEPVFAWTRIAMYLISNGPLPEDISDATAVLCKYFLKEISHE